MITDFVQFDASGLREGILQMLAITNEFGGTLGVTTKSVEREYREHGKGNWWTYLLSLIENNEALHDYHIQRNLNYLWAHTKNAEDNWAFGVCKVNTYPRTVHRFWVGGTTPFNVHDSVWCKLVTELSEQMPFIITTDISQARVHGEKQIIDTTLLQNIQGIPVLSEDADLSDILLARPFELLVMTNKQARPFPTLPMSYLTLDQAAKSLTLYRPA